MDEIIYFYTVCIKKLRNKHGYLNICLDGNEEVKKKIKKTPCKILKRISYLWIEAFEIKKFQLFLMSNRDRPILKEEKIV